MAKYKFFCSNCNLEVEKFTSPKIDCIPCSICSQSMIRQFPHIGSKKVTETVDAYCNVRQEEDQTKKTKDRKTEYFWEHEVPRLVQHYSTQTCLEEGWLVYNDKGELVINKPPSKR